MNPHDENDEGFQRLSQALREAQENRRIFIPPTLDESILREARKHFAEEKSPATRAPFFWRWLIGAAVAVLAVCLLILESQRSKPVHFAREDVNRDGQVDILDAMALAAIGETAAPNFDQNGDNRIDATDIDAVALAAVRLDRKPGS